MRKTFWLLLAVVVVVVASAQLEALQDYAADWPSPWHHTVFSVATWQWVGLAFLFVISFIAGLAAKFLFKRLTFLRDRVVPMPMSDDTRASVSRSAGLLAGSLLGSVLLPDLALNDRFLADVQNLLYGIAIFGGVLLLYGYWDATCETIAARAAGFDRAERLLVPMMRKFVRAIIVIGGLIFAVNVYFGTKTLAGLAAGLGVTGLVVALAAKDSVENVFGSLTILFDMPFALGDWVRIDKVEGTVEQINLRSTRIRTAEDTLINLPNANLIRAAVENFGARRYRRQKLTLRLSYASEPAGIDAFCDALRAYLNALPLTVNSKTLVELDDPMETSVGVVVMWFLETTSAQEEAKSRHALLDEALRLKKSHGVVFAALPQA